MPGEAAWINGDQELGTQVQRARTAFTATRNSGLYSISDPDFICQVEIIVPAAVGYGFVTFDICFHQLPSFISESLYQEVEEEDHGH